MNDSPEKSSKPDSAATVALFDSLFAGLRDAQGHFEKSNSNNYGRDGAALALQSVIEFVRLLRPAHEERLFAPLVSLLNALHSLDSGKVLPILDPIRKRGGQPDSGIRNSLKGATVFTARRLHETGLRLPRAFHLVARELDKLGFKSAGRSPSKRTVQEWDEAVRADIRCHGEAARVYRDMQDRPRPPAGANPVTVRKILLEDLGDWVRKVRGTDE